MTTPSDAGPFEILKDATTQLLTVIGCIPLEMDGDEAMTFVYDAASDLDFALTRAKEVEAATDTGGTRLELTLEEARLVRAALLYVADHIGGWEPASYDGPPSANDVILAVRRRINQGVVRRCEARTTTTDETFRPRPADACASSDDEEVAT